jgi:hypothetical protein
VFGVAAFFQPAIGDAFKGGEEAVSRSVNDAVYGGTLFATAGLGVVLFVVGTVLLGLAASRSREVPVWAGRSLAVAGVVFPIAGFTYEVAQPVAGFAIAVAAAVIARRLRQGRRL